MTALAINPASRSVATIFFMYFPFTLRGKNPSEITKLRKQRGAGACFGAITKQKSKPRLLRCDHDKIRMPVAIDETIQSLAPRGSERARQAPHAGRHSQDASTHYGIRGMRRLQE
jgi:hypothetical protein